MKDKPNLKQAKTERDTSQREDIQMASGFMDKQ